VRESRIAAMQAAHRAPPPPSHALSGVLRAKGFEVDDFEVEEDEAPSWSDLFDGAGGMLRVRCWSTGEERVYRTGSGSAWLGAFLMDLGGGHFARAARGLGASRG
jgi:hypothetical protein